MDGIVHATEVLQNAYGPITLHDGDIQNYLGMTLDFTIEDQVTITMPKYIDDILLFADVTGTASSPTGSDFYDVDPNSPVLPASESKRFHTLVAKLLYLAKRARPDFLLATSFLASRVKCATQQDYAKVIRAYKYLAGTRDVGMRLSVSDPIVVTTYIDVSHCSLPDFRSQASDYVTLGAGPVLASSTSLKVNTKASTESELYGVSENLGSAIGIQQFLYYQGIETGPVILKEDNISTITMMKNGRGSSKRSKHIDIRTYWMKNLIDLGKLIVEYCPAALMLADFNTKPYRGLTYYKASMDYLNWIKATV
jgi:hypothetical protein